MTTTAARVTCLAAVVVLGVPGAAWGHPEGLQPYRYVVAPPGVQSEGPPEAGSSVQPVGVAAFAGTTDNQMQLTLPPGALPPRAGEQGVRVVLDQLDPATLPPLPAGLEAEGNAYRVTLAYARSGAPVERLQGATLSLTAPAPPSGLRELVGGAWRPLPASVVVGDEVVSSVVALERPGTLLQVYDPRDVPRSPTPAAAARPADPGREPAVLPAVAAVALLGLVVGALVLRRRRR